jgi:hypothetical protein
MGERGHGMTPPGPPGAAGAAPEVLAAVAAAIHDRRCPRCPSDGHGYGALDRDLAEVALSAAAAAMSPDLVADIAKALRADALLDNAGYIEGDEERAAEVALRVAAPVITREAAQEERERWRRVAAEMAAMYCGCDVFQAFLEQINGDAAQALPGAPVVNAALAVDEMGTPCWPCQRVALGSGRTALCRCLLFCGAEGCTGARPGEGTG